MKSIIVFLLCLCMSFSTSALKTDFSKSYVGCKYPVEKTDMGVVKEVVKEQHSLSGAECCSHIYSHIVRSKNDDLLSPVVVGVCCLNIRNYKPVICKLWPYRVDQRSWLRLIIPSKKIQ